MMSFPGPPSSFSDRALPRIRSFPGPPVTNTTGLGWRWLSQVPCRLSRRVSVSLRSPSEMSARSTFGGTASIGVWQTTVLGEELVQLGSELWTPARSTIVTANSSIVIVTRLRSPRSARKTSPSSFWLGPRSTSATVLADAGAAAVAATAATASAAAARAAGRRRPVARRARPHSRSVAPVIGAAL